MFNDHQKRLWGKLIEFIKQYREDNISFTELVSNLHGAMQAGEFKNEELIKQWYSYWGNLEIHNAVSLDRDLPILKKDVERDVEKMKNFLVNELNP